MTNVVGSGGSLEETLTSALSKEVRWPGGVAGIFARALLAEDVRRLVVRLDAARDEETANLSLSDLVAGMRLVLASASVSSVRCALDCSRIHTLAEDGRNGMVELLMLLMEATTEAADCALSLRFDSDLGLARDGEFLELAAHGDRCGWQVRTGRSAPDQLPMRLEVDFGDESAIVAADVGGLERDGLACQLRWSTTKGEVPQPPPITLDGAWLRGFKLLDRLSALAEPLSERSGDRRSVGDLFGSNIVLRDLEPRRNDLPGLSLLQAEFGWDRVYLPRKNDSNYAQVVLRILDGLVPASSGPVLYFGDTLLNDGTAICSLAALAEESRVWGFLCGASKAGQPFDFAIGQVYFSSEWSSAAGFLNWVRETGAEFDQKCCAVFDLDQTVYAAKGRDDAPIHAARWEAVEGYLRTVLPDYRFDAARAEALYREFDRDQFHPVTRDNMDYVVLLVLAVASGLADVAEIRDYAQSGTPSIGALAEELRRRASTRVGHEEIGGVLEAVKAIHFNTLAGDQTPCKDFRALEARAMDRRMRGVDFALDDQVLLNGELVDVIDFLSGLEVNLLALSDRPVEAAVVDSEVDLMLTAMATRGPSIRGLIRS